MRIPSSSAVGAAGVPRHRHHHRVVRERPSIAAASGSLRAAGCGTPASAMEAGIPFARLTPAYQAIAASPSRVVTRGTELEMAGRGADPGNVRWWARPPVDFASEPASWSGEHADVASQLPDWVTFGCRKGPSVHAPTQGSACTSPSPRGIAPKGRLGRGCRGTSFHDQQSLDDSTRMTLGLYSGGLIGGCLRWRTRQISNALSSTTNTTRRRGRHERQAERCSRG